MKEFQKFHVSQKAMLMKDGRCLIVRLFEEEGHIASLKWDFPGGRIDAGEEGEAAFLREMEEETGLLADDFTDLGAADYLIRYPKDDFHPFCGVIRLLEKKNDKEIRLNFEHIELAWISADEIGDYEFCWPEMPKLMKRGFEIYEKIKE